MLTDGDDDKKPRKDRFLQSLVHDKAVNSAYFSHVDGTRLLTTDQHRYVHINYYLIHSLLHSVEKSSKTRSPFLRKNCHFFRQINAFTKEVTKELISRNFFSVIAFYSTFPHCV